MFLQEAHKQIRLGRTIMANIVKQRRVAWLAIGALAGFLIAAFLPAQKSQAVATHGQDGFVLATGLLDSNVEGVYFLDGLTGVLRGSVLNVYNGQFTASFEANVLNDMHLDTVKNPKFLMVTGLANLRRGPTQFQPGESVIYVAEVSSGTLAAYAVRWNVGVAINPTPALKAASFAFLGTIPLRSVAVRPQ
jgi:hypothetical protein